MSKEPVKGTKKNGVYQVNQTTGRLSYKGQYGGGSGRGARAIQNNIRTVGARQAARSRRAGL